MSSAKHSKEKEPRHVRLYHWLTDTQAWQDLDAVARCVYLEIARRYGGPDSNNGRIPCSLLELAIALRVSKQTAMRALARLQDHGFIVLTKQGAFSVKNRQATEWRLTEFKCDVTKQLATKEFSRWKKSEHGSTTKPERVSTWNRTVVEKEQVTKENRPYGSTTTPVEQSHGSTTTPLVVYQGGYASEAHPEETEPASAALRTQVCQATDTAPDLTVTVIGEGRPRLGRIFNSGRTSMPGRVSIALSETNCIGNIYD